MNGASQHFNVLIVDDEPGDIDLTKIALAQSSLPCFPHVAHNGREALAFLKREGDRFVGAPKPDLILLDLNMPQMTGLEFLKVAKADPDLSAIPVVILTTSDAPRDVRTSYQLGAAGFVTKPAGIDALAAALNGIAEYWFNTVRRPGAAL